MVEPADLGVLGYVMLHSKTIADALTAYQRYNVILCNVTPGQYRSSINRLS